MATFAFLSSKLDTYESNAIKEAAFELYDNVIVISSINNFGIKMYDGVTQVFLKGRPFSPDTLLIRSTKNLNGELLSALTACLRHTGVDVVDPQSRFKTVGGSKLETSIQRFQEGIGPESYFTFSIIAANDIINRIEFPIIAKPIAGSHKKGFKKFPSDNENNRNKLQEYIDELYSEDRNAVLFLQTRQRRVKEYRVITLDDNVISAVRRLPSRDEDTEERMELINERKMNEIKNFIEEVMPLGVYGFDIMKVNSREGQKYVIIEGNRSPQFKAVDRILECNIGREIVKLCRERVVV